VKTHSSQQSKILKTKHGRNAKTLSIYLLFKYVNHLAKTDNLKIKYTNA
jgi:hypothetical protein